MTPSFNLGNFLMMKDDLTWRPVNSENRTDLFNGWRDWENKNPKLVAENWRVPTFPELKLIGQLSLLGVGSFEDIDRPYTIVAQDKGYWSQTQDEKNWWKFKIIYFDDYRGSRELKFGSSSSLDKERNRIRLIKDV